MTASEPELFPVELPPRLRLERISITGIKAIDHLELSFPPPDLPGDPDVFVLGSRNGVGKTSVLEACTLLMATPRLQVVYSPHFPSPPSSGAVIWPSFNPNGLSANDAPSQLCSLIRASEQQAVAVGDFIAGQSTWRRKVVLTRTGQPTLQEFGEVPPEQKKGFATNTGIAQLERVVAGTISDPVVLPVLLYFHSFRRVQEGSESLSALTGRRGPNPDYEGHSSPISVFKQELLRALMGRAALFEQIGGDDGRTVLEKLNGLVATYARGKIDKLLPQPDETFDFRVQPLAGGPTYSFDSLSSGQKEVISTLFLIWLFTRDQPAVVLIDEPELHLNPEWHRTFVRDLAGIAPNNQYILATHSEEIFASVDPAHRALLEPDGGAQ